MFLQEENEEMSEKNMNDRKSYSVRKKYFIQRFSFIFSKLLTEEKLAVEDT